MRRLNWAGAVALTLALPGRTVGLDIVSAAREIYCYTNVSCAPPIEVWRTPDTPLAAFGDSLLHSQSCSGGDVNAYAAAIQRSSIRSDSILIESTVQSSAEGEVGVRGIARSVGTITFRVASERRALCTVYVAMWSISSGGRYGYVRQNFTLTGANGLVDSMSCQAGPGPSHDRTNSIYHTHILDPGDYTLDARATADGDMGVDGELWLKVAVVDIVPVKPTTWSEVKSLYKDATK